tara:strand:+ start:3477 stop:4166 length:690 start_codon:yes stop_codon:yes gene_type:complete
MNTTTIEVPPSKTRFLVYDVETTGLLPRNKTNLDLSKCPHIIQLSFVIYDIKKNEIVSEYDSYIKNDDIVIPDVVTDLTGITNKKCIEKGNSIIEVLEKFYEAYMFCDGLVAHNMDFDETMIKIELERNRNLIMAKAPYCYMIFNDMYEKVHNIERFCTMKKGTDVCDLYLEAQDGKPRKKKWPRLNELWNHYFPNESIQGFHNSLIDVKACLKCYLKMRYNYENNKII